MYLIVLYNRWSGHPGIGDYGQETQKNLPLIDHGAYFTSTE